MSTDFTTSTTSASTSALTSASASVVSASVSSSLSSTTSKDNDDNVPIDEVLKTLHSMSGVNKSCHTLPISRYLRVAMSHLDVWSIRHILKHHPKIITTRNEENDNLPIHDIVDQYFDVKGAIDHEDNDAMIIYLLQTRLSRMTKILRLFIEQGVQNDSGDGVDGVVGGVAGAGGLFELNQEQIDFVTKRRRAPFHILLSKFELILKYCTKERRRDKNNQHSDQEREGRNTLLKDTKNCIQFCIDIAVKAWKAQGCKDPFTIMNIAIEVFPLLKIKTIEYILHNFDQVPTNTPNVAKYPLHYRDLEGRTILIKAVYEATKRKRTWGDWKSRFHVILFDNQANGRFEQCWIRDSQGRLPIHIAMERGLEWSNGLKELAEIDSAVLLEPDPMNGLQPFAIAASNKPISSSFSASCSHLNLIMDLIVANPSVIQRVPLPKSKQKRRRLLNYSTPVRRSKRLLVQQNQQSLQS